MHAIGGDATIVVQQGTEVITALRKIRDWNWDPGLDELVDSFQGDRNDTVHGVNGHERFELTSVPHDSRWLTLVDFQKRKNDGDARRPRRRRHREVPAARLHADGWRGQLRCAGREDHPEPGLSLLEGPRPVDDERPCGVARVEIHDVTAGWSGHGTWGTVARDRREIGCLPWRGSGA